MKGGITSEVAAVLGGRYPEFVYRSRPHRRPRSLSYLPVFAFHTLEPTDFEEKLRFLSENGYRTVTLDEAVQWMRGDIHLPERSVALTIDDGRLTTWTVGYPLLKRYGMRATAFVIPWYIDDAAPRPTLEDVWRGTCCIERVAVNEDEDRCRMVSWAEVQHMHATGVIAIESHTMTHRRIHTTHDIIDFVTPVSASYVYDTPVMQGMSGWYSEGPGSIAGQLGRPIFWSAPILATARELLVPREAVEPLIQFVCDRGGAAYFTNFKWRCELTALAQTLPLRATSHRSTARAQVWEVLESKRTIEAMLPGKVVRHLAYPNGQGSDAAMRCCAEQGYSSTLWTMLDARSTNRRGCDPFRIGRLKHDFIYRLPGDSRACTKRRSLVAVLSSKVARRLNGQTGY